MTSTETSNLHPALIAGKVAVVTGGASGIGLAAARRYAGLGLHTVIADRPGAALEAAADQVRGACAASATVTAIGVDVARFEDLQALAARAEAIGEVAVLMNNAGTGAGAPSSWEGLDRWRALLETNLWGVIHGVHAFAPGMIARAQPAVIVNTGSKQGITLPPGNPAYNLSKAGVRAYTETLAHELYGVAGGVVSAHLLIPGYTFTGMTARSAEKPPGAWTADQVIDFLLQALSRRDFYVLCPDNDVTRAMDEKRIAWMAGDLIENRPALSRWRPDYAGAFADFMKG
jgi:NAD(P)-dependent dehydrogenase (short-subunit alcohol dehydrogenase family)